MNFYCIYCSQRCTKMHPTSVYWKCKECKVTYTEGWDETDLNTIEFIRKFREGDLSYRLTLHIQENRTLLTSIKEGFSSVLGAVDDYDTLIDVKGVLNGVSPENVEDKIKHLLLFL